MSSPEAIRVRSVPARWREVALPAAVFAGGAIRPFMESMNPVSPPPGMMAAYLGVLLVGSLVLPLRHRWPTSALVVTTASSVFLVATGLNWIGALLPVGVCVYAICSGLSRRAALLRVVPATVLVVVACAAPPWLRDGDPVVIPVLLALVATAAFGRNARARKRYLAAVVQRADAIEQNAEHEVRRRFAERKLAMARELHDTVAHHMTIINVQAGVAADAIGQDPDRAAESVRHCKTAAQQALAELYMILRVLRGPGDELDGPPDGWTSPTRAWHGMAVSRLVAEERARGTEVSVENLDVLDEVGPELRAVIYPVVQESLTNSRKHAPGAAVDIRLENRDGWLRVEVINGPRKADLTIPVGGSHSGLVGIRERVVGFGGTASWGSTPSGGFRLVVRVPSDGGTSGGEAS